MGGSGRTPSYLVLLLEAVSLRAFHLGDVLEEVGHADGWVQLTRVVRHVHRLALSQGVGVRLHQAAGVAAQVLALVCTKTRKEDRVRTGPAKDVFVHLTVGDIMFEAVNKRLERLQLPISEDMNVHTYVVNNFLCTVISITLCILTQQSPSFFAPCTGLMSEWPLSCGG